MKTAGNILEDERNAQLRESRTAPEVATPIQKQNAASNVNVPLPILRWLVYLVLFLAVLIPWLVEAAPVWKWFSSAMIFAHFSGQLNSLRNDKK